jgi:hypothetical protein
MNMQFDRSASQTASTHISNTPAGRFLTVGLEQLAEAPTTRFALWAPLLGTTVPGSYRCLGAKAI